MSWDSDCRDGGSGDPIGDMQCLTQPRFGPLAKFCRAAGKESPFSDNSSGCGAVASVAVMHFWVASREL